MGKVIAGQRASARTGNRSLNLREQETATQVIRLLASGCGHETPETSRTP